MKLKVDPSLEPRMIMYARSLDQIRQVHAAKLRSGLSQIFPISPSQLTRLVHFTPLIPMQARYLNLGTFLSKPAAHDFQFLSPLVECARPAAAKHAFFGALSELKKIVSIASAQT